MSRYIDADAFLKEYCEPYPHVYMAMSKAVADAPTIDIVRCKECKHCKKFRGTFRGEPINYYHCNEHSRDVENDDFCSYGEREGE